MTKCQWDSEHEGSIPFQCKKKYSQQLDPAWNGFYFFMRILISNAKLEYHDDVERRPISLAASQELSKKYLRNAAASSPLHSQGMPSTINVFSYTI